MRKNLRVVVIHPNDADGGVLTNHLQRMGFSVQGFWPVPLAPPENAELIFLALNPEQRDPHENWDKSNCSPIISVITYENPTFIDHALKLGSTAVITTPIRASGLLSAVVMAMEIHRQHKQHLNRIERLEQKLIGMRYTGEAQAILMRMHGIDETHAYEILRRQAMAKRVPIETICQSIIQANEIFSVTAPNNLLKVTNERSLTMDSRDADSDPASNFQHR
ncbi:ANTAR domain-containing response regulator [Polaromonas sp. CG_9.11]|uniref:ANTAR domain-containing response regulator n=1 Tax=Polaromonas sp. CG_9.11 TaxID=2787730 RepID=UPI001A2D6F3D|nr:AmiR/NasT family two-component response regulator [Polaromonas sp. CG_9.11]